MSNSDYSSHNIKYNTNINNNPPIKTELKFGEYFLTPLESFLINKSMPHGFKLELMENLVKFSNSDSKGKNKKNNKYITQSPSDSYNHNHKTNKKGKNSQVKKRINQEFNLDNNYNDLNREKYKIAKKCKVAIEKLKDSSLVNKFYEFDNEETPSLSKVEKKINNYEYDSFYDFEMDIRKIWSYFFYLGEKGDKEIYENTSKMSEKWENICSELENTNDDIYETVSNSVIRRAEKNKKELLEIKQNEKNKINKDNMNNINNINSKEIATPMSREEKNKLGILIQTKLNIDQLRGIAKIIKGKDNLKVLEFDLDKLPNDKLRSLEKFVNECVEKNNLNNNNGNNIKNKNSNINNQNKKGKENEINNKNINSIENEIKKLDDNKEQNIENKMEIKKEKEENKNKENENKNNVEKGSVDKKKSLISDSDSLSSDSSLSD